MYIIPDFFMQTREAICIEKRENVLNFNQKVKEEDEPTMQITK